MDRREGGDVRLYYDRAGLCRYGGAAVFIATWLYQINKKTRMPLNT